uniref:Chitin synthase n=1 Tax=Euplotes harpa TaxID=151035 RepID=A0A7S3J1J5_9SPIT|mmetsp:Transcript_14062/g.16296  ORF Transcript_14062/g.16296 Transcript_14062/m.16296 type:complete len:136 (+) Transcript_14062:161-568(+)
MDTRIPENSLLSNDFHDEIKLSFCITMYNEPFEQLMESLAGIYRAYFELVDIDKDYKDKVNIVIVADGIEKLPPDFKKAAKKAGFFDLDIMEDGYVKFTPPKESKNIDESNDINNHKIEALDLNFMNKDNLEGRK